MSVKIQAVPNSAPAQIAVYSPYHPTFIQKARKLNGKWKSPHWIFDARDEQRVRDVCIAVYGTDGAPVETTTVQMRVDNVRDDQLYAYGRCVLSRPARDSRVKLGDGVIILEGHFSSSCGSRNNPQIGGDNVLLEIRDVPLILVPELARVTAAETEVLK